jgi:hypothetical protein
MLKRAVLEEEMEEILGKITVVDHKAGRLEVCWRRNQKEDHVFFNFCSYYRVYEVVEVDASDVHYKLSVRGFDNDTYPLADDEIVCWVKGDSLVGWCYKLDYDLAHYKYKRKQATRICTTAWMTRLGIASTDKITVNLVNRKFREKSKFVHPDKSGGNPVKFRELVAARDEALATLA